MKFLVALVLGLTLAPPVVASSVATGNALSPLLARLDQTRVIQASYVQTKTLQALKRPLVTHGKLVFVRDRGVLWRIDKPYRASYLLGTDSVTEIAADGRRKLRGVNEVPALAQIGKVFQAIFQGDIQALSNYFEVSRQGDDAHWRLELAPKPQLARFLKSIHAQGSNFLERLDLVEASGDRTRIDFSDSQLDTPLDAADQALFGL